MGPKRKGHTAAASRLKSARCSPLDNNSIDYDDANTSVELDDTTQGTHVQQQDECSPTKASASGSRKTSTSTSGKMKVMYPFGGGPGPALAVRQPKIKGVSLPFVNDSISEEGEGRSVVGKVDQSSQSAASATPIQIQTTQDDELPLPFSSENEVVIAKDAQYKTPCQLQELSEKKQHESTSSPTSNESNVTTPPSAASASTCTSTTGSGGSKDASSILVDGSGKKSDNIAVAKPSAIVIESTLSSSPTEPKPMQSDFHLYADDVYPSVLELCKEECQKLIKNNSLWANAGVAKEITHAESLSYVTMSNLNERLIRAWSEVPEETKHGYRTKEEKDRLRYMKSEAIQSNHCTTTTVRSRRDYGSTNSSTAHSSPAAKKSSFKSQTGSIKRKNEFSPKNARTASQAMSMNPYLPSYNYQRSMTSPAQSSMMSSSAQMFPGYAPNFYPIPIMHPPFPPSFPIPFSSQPVPNVSVGQNTPKVQLSEEMQQEGDKNTPVRGLV